MARKLLITSQPFQYPSSLQYGFSYYLPELVMPRLRFVDFNKRTSAWKLYIVFVEKCLRNLWNPLYSEHPLYKDFEVVVVDSYL